MSTARQWPIRNVEILGRALRMFGAGFFEPAGIKSSITELIQSPSRQTSECRREISAARIESGNTRHAERQPGFGVLSASFDQHIQQFRLRFALSFRQGVCFV